MTLRDPRFTALHVHRAAARRRVFAWAAAALLAFAVLPHRHAAAQQPFTVSSTSLHDGGTVARAQVFNGGDCKGGNRSPELSWDHVPAGTGSFAVTMLDPDASGPGWWHWSVIDIPATVHRLPENASASGYLKTIGAKEARNDFGSDGYGGPCPPPGKPHRYVVTVYALAAKALSPRAGSRASSFDHEIDTSTTLGYARLTVTYGR
jgi:Raf kinase inhibitor-like YbhB/YbcL family protein